MHVRGRRKYFDRLSVMQEALHQVRQPPHLILHDDQLMQKSFAIVRRLRSIARAKLSECEAYEIQWILDFMRQAAGQLSQGRDPLEPVQFLLALARTPELPDHFVEAAGQQAD